MRNFVGNLEPQLQVAQTEIAEPRDSILLPELGEPPALFSSTALLLMNNNFMKYDLMYWRWWIYRSPQIPAGNGKTENAMLKH
jgi:hypothetical protein